MDNTADQTVGNKMGSIPIRHENVSIESVLRGNSESYYEKWKSAAQRTVDVIRTVSQDFSLLQTNTQNTAYIQHNITI